MDKIGGLIIAFAVVTAFFTLINPEVHIYTKTIVTALALVIILGRMEISRLTALTGVKR